MSSAISVKDRRGITFPCFYPLIANAYLMWLSRKARKELANSNRGIGSMPFSGLENRNSPKITKSDTSILAHSDPNIGAMQLDQRLLRSLTHVPSVGGGKDTAKKKRIPAFELALSRSFYLLDHA